MKLKESNKYQSSFPSWTADLHTHSEGKVLDQNEIQRHLSNEEASQFTIFMNGRKSSHLENGQLGVHLSDFIEWLNTPPVASRTYQPDGWTILKFVPRDESHPYFKVFATWRYGNEEWRLSSGSSNTEDIREVNGHIIWPQSSGSIYKLRIKDSEGCYTFWQGEVLKRILEKAEKEINVSIITLNSIPLN